MQRPRRLGCLGSVVLLLLSPLPVPVSAVPGIDLIALARRARPSVALIAVYDRRGNEICTGTGFVVSPDGRVVTNQHVVSGGSSAAARFENGTVIPVERVLAEDRSPADTTAAR